MKAKTIMKQNNAMKFKAKLLEELDLEPIKAKLIDKSSEGWVPEKANKVEKEYKKFLFLCVKYPDSSVVPIESVDKFWHQHILDTSKYAEDCNNIFGYFLHHFPYSGLRGEVDEIKHRKNTEVTQKIYEKEFGAELFNKAGFCIVGCTNCEGVPSSSNDVSRKEVLNLSKASRPTMQDVINAGRNPPPPCTPFSSSS